MRKSLRFRKLQLAALAAAAVAAVVLLFGTGGGGVGTTSAEAAEATTVRIAAQRVEDGRTAFALQVRGDDGWGERIEPRANLFKRVEDARVGRWANSSLLELDSGHTVRISARAEDNGQIEFALQEIIDDAPAERILPRLRKFPASPTVGKWLVSSPIELAAIDTGPPPPTHVALVNYGGQHTANVRYASSLNDDGSVTSNVYTNSEEGGEWATDGFGASFALWCWSGENLGILLDGLAPQDAESLPVTLTIDGAAQPSTDWKIGNHYRDDVVTHSWLELRDAAARTLFAQLQSASQLSAAIDGVSGTHTWNLADTFTTPIQGNLAECGNYVEGQVQEPPPPTYVPVLTAKGRDGNVRYDAYLTDDGQVHTIIDTHGENTEMFLRIGCWGDHFNVLIDKLPPLATDQVEVLWSVDDGETISEMWEVNTFEGSHSYIDSPFAPGMLRTLRGASSFTFWVNAAGIRSVTLDLSNTFGTPVQGNIDNCGAYVEGETREIEHDYVPVVGLRGHSGNASYSAEEYEGSIYSSVTTQSTAIDASAPVLRLAMSCGSELAINIQGLPLIDAESITLTLRIDGGAPITMDWNYRGTEQWTTSWPPESPHDSYSLAAMFRDATTVTVESPDHWDGAVTFDLDGFFGTPVQENLDECGKYKAGETREIQYDYVPWTGEGRESATLDWFARQGDDGITTNVNRVVEVEGADGGRLRLVLGCHASQWFDVKLNGVATPTGELTSARVTLRIDDGDPFTQEWRISVYGEFSSVFATTSGLLYEQLRGASNVVIEIADSGMPPAMFDLAGMFDTPVQENIDNCGKYKAGETRELDLPESPVVSGSTEAPDGESTIDWTHRPSGAAIPEIWARNFLYEGEIKLYFIAGCGPNGVTFLLGGTRFGEISAGQVEVVWSLDGGAEQHQTWLVYEASGFRYVYPDDALALISTWRDGAILDVTIENETAHTQRFNLVELFGTPIQAALDECLALPQPTLPTPAGVVERTIVEQMSYNSGITFGSTVAATTLDLRVPSDSAPAWAGYSSRLSLNCGIGGYRVVIWGVGLDRPVFIRGYTVDVTWRVDGGAETTSTWDVWPGSGDSYDISPQDDAAFYAAIKGADSLTITVASDPEFVETYDFAGNGFWDTPIQPNLDACVGS